jgi:galactose mutarotase-like enzyme
MAHPEFSRSQIDGIGAITLSNDLMSATIVPAVGGRIVSLTHRPTGHEFLWRNGNLRLEALPAGSEYDPNFYGGIDELLPNDLPETVAGVDLPDHGELWTTRLDSLTRHEVSIKTGSSTTVQLFPWRVTKESHPVTREVKSFALNLSATLPRSQLRYERWMGLAPDKPELISAYRITNESDRRQPILWKLHAALNIAPDDRILCPANAARVVDPEYTRWKTLTPFSWPDIDGDRADMVPEKNGTVDFLYLYDLDEGRIAWERPDAGLRFEYRFDTKIFPCAWYFASYGGFLDHYTAILEPCTTMPISVNEAAQNGTCLWLDPGEEVSTVVTAYAGPAVL